MQRVEAWRAETNVRREGTGSPEPRTSAARGLTAGRLSRAWTQRGAARVPRAGVCRQAQPGWRSAGGIRV